MELATIGGGIVAVVAVIVGMVTWLAARPDIAPAVAEDAETQQIVQLETADATSAVRLDTPFVDIAGDPMLLRFAAGGAGQRTLSGPTGLDPGRFGVTKPDQLALLVEDLVVRESRLMTSLPSSREDFAFFQAQRNRSLNLQPTFQTQPAEPVGAGEVVAVTEDDYGWGETIGGSDEVTSYVRTQVQNTTSIAFVRPETTRKTIADELVVRFVRPRPLVDFLADNEIAEEIAVNIDAAARETMPTLAEITTDDGLDTGTIVAIRYTIIDGERTPLHVSIYGPEGRIGAIARDGILGYVFSADPWVNADLLALAEPEQDDLGVSTRDYRLLDAVYSAAIRSGVPTALVGELIVLLSQSYDLEAVATAGDKVTLLYAPDAGDGIGQIAYAAINGPSGNMPCYVSQASDGTDYACFSPRGRVGGKGGAGFVTPVSGTLTSPFGPRFHPVHKVVRLHAGVDWAAPMGTPILAARDGTFAVVGDGGGYGNVIYIDHTDGLQSRYAHMDSFADIAVRGKAVKAGEVIGFVGTTGVSTGPHLHFEMRQNGSPFDPFTLGAGGITASAAVEALTDQIIKVESAGNANAKNPLSTATGLGQFIESTWLRMMRDYRPDLARTLARDKLLDLRRDPTLSREMVQNLARENETFLRARGHRIDAGRLYLAHFLGPAGAHTVLSSSDSQTVLAVMGAGVVNANPFLRNYTIADLKAWAQRKMRGAGGGSSVPPPPPLTPEIRAYIAAIDTILEDQI